MHITPCYVPLFAIFSPSLHFSFLSLLPPFFSHPVDIQRLVSGVFSLSLTVWQMSLSVTAGAVEEGPWWRCIHTSLVKLRHGQSSSPARTLLPAVFSPLPAWQVLSFFSDSSSIGWASSLIGVAVCGWLGSVKESPERGTSRWMDSGVTAPGAEGWLLFIITAGKREMDFYTQSQIHSLSHQHTLSRFLLHTHTTQVRLHFGMNILSGIDDRNH